MVKRKNRKISGQTAKAMLAWSHCKFRERLKHKAREYPNCTVLECSEAYTSKTCTQCGNIDWKLKGGKVYKCKKCRVKLDRDANGARNILLRNLEAYGIHL
jgi:putative transposase